jgi:chemotaxis protein methyltransferase CheR
LIYFDLESKRRVLRHFRDSLLPHGYLFLGNSESLYGVSDEFHLIHFAGCTGYMKSAARPLTGGTCK